ncbi:MAG: hypothetical protein QMD80_09180, partial [archaeon]|nr:hypothetical protein [archaeon]
MKSKGKNESEEGERKRQQEMAESVIGILLVLIMVASVIAMLTHSTSGSDITQTTIRNGYIVNPDNVTISINENTTAILIGQNVQFMCEGSKTGTVTATGVKGTPAEGYVVTSDSTGWLDTSMIVEGLYNATYDEHWELLAVQTPVMVLSLKVGTKEVSSICRGTPLGIDFTSNLDENDCVDLKVVDPTGSIIKVINNQKFDDINVSQLLEYGSMNESKQINTTGWRVGTYTFSVRTEEENARGLAMLSNTRTLVILKAEVDIVAEKTSVVELERVRLIIRGVCNHNITINSSDPAHTIFPAGYEDNPPYDTSGFNDTIDE